MSSTTLHQDATVPDPVDPFVAFWHERHLCTLTTLRTDGTPHVTPVGAALDEEHGLAWVISSRRSQKVRNIQAAGEDGAAVALCQVDGPRWASIEGRAVVLDDPASVRHAELLYTLRYRRPRENPDRVAIRVSVTRTLGRVGG